MRRSPLSNATRSARPDFAGSLALNLALKDLVVPVNAMVGDEAGQLGLDEWAYASGGFVPDFVKLDIDGGERQAPFGPPREFSRSATRR